ncbi:MAG TPA: formylglycine-generating enzyme family protein [Accumulibacter sp.]|uniref:formylglycine-generating enzyme family protein n=1 Tax=Accumulibacter sp. TaxID=2053492 RepID=UPI002C8B362A|nr:formylglycine-generating enzyme family protein [Accumulibacter sp.]HRF73533.1 formylglycine-generating enzyme family protein [Accumulibacter sp.]
MTHRVLWGAVLLGVACAAWGFLPDEPKPVPKAVPKAVPKPLPKAAPKPQEAAPVVAPPAKAATERRPGEVFRDCSDCPEMVVVPAGSFDMGGSGSVESPVHRVNLRSFAMGKTEVTQGQWRAVMGSNPSSFSNCGADCPVEQVSWNDAQDYVRKLSANTGKTYRLPSEAEWEYACRAGGRHEYCGGDSIESVAWYDSNSGNKTHSHSVAGKQANAFGLYDMSGNVWEWTEDCWNGSYNGAPSDGSAWTSGDCGRRVLRGGSWYNEPQYARSAKRDRYGTTNRSIVNGFRLARMLP